MAAKDFDDLLEHVGGFGRFQKILLIMFFPFMLCYVSIYFGQIFFAHTPDHWCRVPKLQSLPQDLRLKLSIPQEDKNGLVAHSNCRMYDVDYTEVLNTQQAPNSTSPTTSCKHGWEYNFNETFPTLVSDMNWVCDDSWKPSTGQSLFFVGSVLGSLIFGFIGDRYGRLPAMILSNILACAASIATAFITDFTVFVCLRLIMGLAYDNCYVMAYICILEYVNADKRALVANLPFVVFVTLGLVAMPWIGYGLWDWKIFCFVISVPMASVVFTLFIIPESSRWLLSRGNYERARGIFVKVAKINGKVIKQEVFQDLKVLAEQFKEERKISKKTTLDLFKTPNMRKRILLMAVLQIILMMVYDGQVRNVENLDMSLFITFTITGVVEAPACFLPIVLMDRLGRRWTCGMPMVLSGVLYLIIITISRADTVFITVLAMLSRLFIVVSLNASLQYFVELLPTQLRGQGTNLVHIAGHLSTFCSPLIVHLSETNYYYPFLVLGAFSVAGGIITLFLPETADERLPETADDVEGISNNHGFFFVPCLEKSAHGNNIRLETSRNPERSYGARDEIGMENPTFQHD